MIAVEYSRPQQMTFGHVHPLPHVPPSRADRHRPDFRAAWIGLHASYGGRGFGRKTSAEGVGSSDGARSVGKDLRRRYAVARRKGQTTTGCKEWVRRHCADAQAWFDLKRGKGRNKRK